MAAAGGGKEAAGVVEREQNQELCGGFDCVGRSGDPHFTVVLRSVVQITWNL